jgi:hypothetical protein
LWADGASWQPHKAAGPAAFRGRQLPVRPTGRDGGAGGGRSGVRHDEGCTCIASLPPTRLLMLLLQAVCQQLCCEGE